MKMYHVDEDTTLSERLERPSRVQFSASNVEAVKKKRRIHDADEDESRLRRSWRRRPSRQVWENLTRDSIGGDVHDRYTIDTDQGTGRN